MIIDAFEFSRKTQKATGRLLVRDLTRIEWADTGGALDWKLSGSLDDRSRPFLNLGVSGAVQLICQRCLAPVNIAVLVDARFLVADSDAQADAVPLDEDGYDVVVGSHAFDVLSLVEDEVILWLPSVPKHEHCPEQGGSVGLSDGSEAKISPFSVLGAMRKPREP